MKTPGLSETTINNEQCPRLAAGIVLSEYPWTARARNGDQEAIAFASTLSRKRGTVLTVPVLAAMYPGNVATAS